MEALERARLSLDGLSVGDALGQRFFGPGDVVRERIAQRALPPAPWRYTDDTEMAISVVDVLRRLGRVDAGALAQEFARRYDPSRGYGAAAHELLQQIRAGGDWHEMASRLFDGSGSYGNGAAMRVAPLGAYFADNLEQARENAVLSAITTHTHPEGVAGAVAVAVATALAWQRSQRGELGEAGFLVEVAQQVPLSQTRSSIQAAAELPPGTSVIEAAKRLGSGQQISAQDTVPFSLWCAALHLDSYEDAFWSTVSGLGDRDTTCAMVGGIVALSDRGQGIPERWLTSRERLPQQQ